MYRRYKNIITINTKKRKYTKFLLGSKQDKIVVAFKTKKGEVASFKIQYMTLTERGWRTVIRYDTYHRHAHRHTFHYSKKKYSRRIGIVGDYGAIFTISLEDIKNNWQKIKQNFLIQ